MSAAGIGRNAELSARRGRRVAAGNWPKETKRRSSTTNAAPCNCLRAGAEMRRPSIALPIKGDLIGEGLTLASAGFFWSLTSVRGADADLDVVGSLGQRGRAHRCRRTNLPWRKGAGR